MAQSEGCARATIRPIIQLYKPTIEEPLKNGLRQRAILGSSIVRLRASVSERQFDQSKWRRARAVPERQFDQSVNCTRVQVHEPKDVRNKKGASRNRKPSNTGEET